MLGGRGSSTLDASPVDNSMRTSILVSLFSVALLTALPGVAHAGPEAAEASADAPADGPEEGAEAPSEAVGGSDAAPEAEAEAPETAPEEPAPVADPATEDSTEGPAETGTTSVGGDPTQGSEARAPGKKIQLPVDIGDKHSITYTSLLAPRINPLGLEERLWIGYQYRLYDKEKAILNGSNIGLFFRPVVSPAIALVGATLQIQPAAVFRFRATYSYVQYFGTFQFFQSYQSPYDDYSDTQLDTARDAGLNYATGGHQVELEALVQARYKGLVLRSSTVMVYNTFNNLPEDRAADDLFYAIRYDTLTPTQGWMLSNDSDLLWLQDIKGPRHASLLAGVRATTVMPFYNESVYEDGDDASTNPNGPQLRIGPSIGYIFYDRPDRFPRFNRPTLILQPQWHVLHRWRTGEAIVDGQDVGVSQAMPTIVIAFVFTGQLWGRN